MSEATEEGVARYIKPQFPSVICRGRTRTVLESQNLTFGRQTLPSDLQYNSTAHARSPPTHETDHDEQLNSEELRHKSGLPTYVFDFLSGSRHGPFSRPRRSFPLYII